MNILMVLPIYPWPIDSGWAQRFHLAAESLAARHNVTLLAHHVADKPPVRNSPLEKSCRVLVAHEAPQVMPGGAILAGVPNLARTLSHKPKSLLGRRSKRLLGAIRQVRKQSNFDCVWAARVWNAEMVREAGFSRIVVDVDDVPSIALGRRLATQSRSWRLLGSYVELLKLRAYERTLSVRFWRVVVSKSEDLPEKRGSEGRWFVVPNGIVAPADMAPTEQVCGEMLFVGHMDHDPNIDAIRHFICDILPRIREACPSAKFVIAGKGWNDEVATLAAQARCRVEWSVPDLDPLYARASVVVVPVRHGSGTRIKLLEALARAKCVVSTSVGAEGLNLRPGIDLEVTDSSQKFADSCVSLLRDPDRRQALGRSGRDRISSCFSRKHVGDAIDAVLNQVPIGTEGNERVSQTELSRHWMTAAGPRRGSTRGNTEGTRS